MLIVLSPAKSLDYNTPPHINRYTLPEFIDDATELIGLLRQLSPAQISTLMRISDPLAQLNFERFAAWSPHFEAGANSLKQAVLAFDGDVYERLDARSMSSDALDFAQRHIRILSGLYGILRPLDLIQPYRLEMGTRLSNARGKDLYAFWGGRITAALNRSLYSIEASDQHSSKRQTLVNLASQEYFRSVCPRMLEAQIITPVFEDWYQSHYKIISFYAKRARGLMARYAVEHRIDEVEHLQAFDSEGYAFDANRSDEACWVFRRRLVS